MKLLRIVKAHNHLKKWRAVFEIDGKEHSTEFGDSSAEDYTQHQDPERRLLYRKRHRKDLETNDPTRAGFLSWWILWGDSTSIQKNISSYKKRFNL